MKLIFTSYSSSPEFNQPEAWLKRIEGYTGILESLSHDHTVIGIERINFEGEYKHHGVQYIFTRQKKKTVLFPFRIHRLVKQQKPDIVIINGLIFPLQIIQLRLTVGRKVKIFLIHQAEKPFTGIKKWLQKLASNAVNAFLFTSTEFGDQWIEKGNISDPKKIHEVLHGSSVFKPGDKAAARTALAISGSPVFLWVGRLDANKDPVTVLKGFINFLSFQPSATLYMIYHTLDCLSEVMDLIAGDEKARLAIKLVGKLAHQELQDWYNSADFIISGSHYEGGGIAVCEAMSCGVIPVLTNIVSFRRMTGPGKCGLLFEPGNAKDLLKVLLQTKEMDIETERIKTLQQFKNELSFEAIARKLEAVMTFIPPTSPSRIP